MNVSEVGFLCCHMLNFAWSQVLYMDPCCQNSDFVTAPPHPNRNALINTNKNHLFILNTPLSFHLERDKQLITVLSLSLPDKNIDGVFSSP